MVNTEPLFESVAMRRIHPLAVEGMSPRRLYSQAIYTEIICFTEVLPSHKKLDC